MEPEPLCVLWEDNHLLAVAKPPGMLVQGDRTGDPTLLDAARSYLKEKYVKPGRVYLGLVHRLDRPVSGVVLFARTSKAAGRLARQFRERTVVKVYLAVVLGAPPAAAGELAAYLTERTDKRGVVSASAREVRGTRPARLRYERLGREGSRTLLRVEPITGRRHQIRVQLARAGCPILGDVKYGARERLPDRSLALHALRLEIDHPVRHEPVVLTAPLPAHWPWSDARILEELTK
jgi:23S rRNA pseudouridine1911/1915/1917 synthase